MVALPRLCVAFGPLPESLIAVGVLNSLNTGALSLAGYSQILILEIEGAKSGRSSFLWQKGWPAGAA